MPDPRSLLGEVSSAVTELAARAAPSLVALSGPRVQASGFVWRPGLVVTADEALVDDADLSITLHGGRTVSARVAGRDSTTDLAVLRVDTDAVEPVALDPSPVPPGMVVVAAGALDGALTVALGLVARSTGAWRSIRGGAIDARIELAVGLRSSSEGGLAFGAHGRAIGMTVFGPRCSVLVIPASTIERVAMRLERDGRIARGYLGVGLRPVRVDDDRTGAMVVSVDPAGPGARAGLRQGDIVTGWNAGPMPHLMGLMRALGPDSVGTVVTLALSRAGDRHEVALKIAERPAD